MSMLAAFLVGFGLGVALTAAGFALWAYNAMDPHA